MKVQLRSWVKLCRTFAFLPILCQNEALGASADVGVSGADALMLAAVLEGLTHVQTCADMQANELRLVSL